MKTPQKISHLHFLTLGSHLFKTSKALLFLNDFGCNGKGTLLELMRGLCGHSATSVSLKTLGQRFGTASIYGKTAILSDENDTKGFIEDAELLKAIITSDVISLEQKHKDRFSYRFRGLAIFCCNAIPHFKDHSTSLYRRLLPVTFENTFYKNGENKAIKDDFVKRPEVLEYVLKRALEMDFYEFSEPEACILALENVKVTNDPVRQFIEDVFPEFVWDFIPFDFLYDAYKSYYRENTPSGQVMGKITFMSELLDILGSGDYGWFCQDRTKPVRVGHMMDAPEPMILKMHLEKWENPVYRGSDPTKICLAPRKELARGIRRKIDPETQSEQDTEN